MIWDHADDDPYKDDIIRMELAEEASEAGDGTIIDLEHEAQLEEQKAREYEQANRRLNEILDFYDCARLLPFVQRIFNIRNEKDATGVMPPAYVGAYHEMRGLITLKEEEKKKEIFESQKMRKESEAQQRTARSHAGAAGARGRGGSHHMSTIPRRARR